MKRVLTILAILLLPLSVWAMTPVTDSDLSKVTGQAGVSINQDVMMNIHMDVMAWGDADGLGKAGIGSAYYSYLRSQSMEHRYRGWLHWYQRL